MRLLNNNFERTSNESSLNSLHVQHVRGFERMFREQNTATIVPLIVSAADLWTAASSIVQPARVPLLYSCSCVREAGDKPMNAGLPPLLL